MSTVFDVFNGLSYPYFRDGSPVPSGSYPAETYITYWKASSRTTNYNNKPAMVRDTWDICAFTTDPEQVYSMMDTVKTAFSDAGFTITVEPHDVSAAMSDYYGEEMTVAQLTAIDI